jgi:hypothetical protein
MLHAPTSRRERIVGYGDRGGGKSSTYISIADWLERTGSDRKVWLFDSDLGWDANRDETGALDSFVEVISVDREQYGGSGGWTAKLRQVRGQVHCDDWAVVDLQTHAWEGAQRYYWGEKSGNDSLAELWLRNRPQDVSGDHGTNWGVINKFYGEWTASVVNLGCHVLFLASASEMRRGDAEPLDSRNFYGNVGWRVEGQKDLRGEGNTVLYMFEANGRYRYSTVKERGPIGRGKRERLVNEDVTDKGFVPGYLIRVAGWRP